MLSAFLDGLLAGAAARDRTSIPVTVQLSVTFLDMGRAGEWVLGEARLTRATRDMAFAEGRVEELNAIVHPAAIARQAELTQEIAAREPDAVVIVESALIFETKYGGEGGWHTRFDRLILVRARDERKIARFVARAASSESRETLEADARSRLAQQIDDQAKAAHCDDVLTNDGTLAELQAQVDALWPVLRDAARTANGDVR